MSEREDGGKREWLKASGKRMNKARTNEMRDPSGWRKFLFFLTLHFRTIKVKFESTDDISPFSTFRHFPSS